MIEMHVVVTGLHCVPLNGRLMFVLYACRFVCRGQHFTMFDY